MMYLLVESLDCRNLGGVMIWLAPLECITGHFRGLFWKGKLKKLAILNKITGFYAFSKDFTAPNFMYFDIGYICD